MSSSNNMLLYLLIGGGLLIAYQRGLLNGVLSQLGLSPASGLDIDEDKPNQSLRVPSAPVSAPVVNVPIPSTPLAAGSYVPIMGSQLTVQQANKYKLVPGTDGKGPAGVQLYQIGGKRRVITGNFQSGSQGASDGIRNNIINMPDLVNREVTWIFTIHEIRNTKDKDHYGSKCGSHSDSGSQLYTNSVQYFTSGPLKHQQESPHGRYVKCGSCGKQDNPCPPIGVKTAYPVKIEKRIGWKFVQWGLGGGSQHYEVWVDYTNGGSRWVKIGHMDDMMPGCCQTPPVGHLGRIPAPAPGNGNIEDTMRVNGGVVTWHAQSIVEITPPSAPRMSAAAYYYRRYY